MTLSLQVPIDFDPVGYSSSTGAITFERSRFPLDTTLFDNATYLWEIVGQNTHASIDYTVDLLDSSGTAKASITIPANTTSARRLRVTWTPNTGSDNYRFRTPATAFAGNVNVYMSRIIVEQIDGEKSQLTFPLVQRAWNYVTPFDNAQNGVADEVIPITFQQPTPARYSLFRKDSTVYDTLIGSNTWRFVCVLAVSNATDNVHAALFNATTNAEITGTVVNTTATVPTLLTASFLDTATNFSNGDNMEVRIRTSNALAFGRLFSAYLQVTLDPLNLVEVFWRFMKQGSFTADQTFDGQRVLYDASKYGLPVVYHESTGSRTGNNDCFVRDHDTNDSGTNGANVANSGINFGGGTKSRVRTIAITPDSGDRFIARVERASGTLDWTHGWLVVQAGAAGGLPTPSLPHLRDHQIMKAMLAR